MSGHRPSAFIRGLATSRRALRERLSLAVAILLAVACSGCARFSPDGGMATVNGVVTPALGSPVVKVTGEDVASEAHVRAARLLASPLSADTAVRIAFLNNKGLQASYNALGIAEAARIEASLPPNPTFSLSRIQTPVELDIERSIVLDILALATLPARADLAGERFHAAQLGAALETLRIGFQTRRAYYRAVAAEALAASLAQAVSAAGSAATLAKELGETGAMSKLDQAREEAFHTELSLQLAAARQRAVSERERLVRLLGLPSDAGLRLPHALPLLPASLRAPVAVETEAIRRRVDLKIARIEVDTLAKSYGLTEATRFINLLDVAGISRTQREPGVAGTGGGFDVEFQIPIFDFGEVRVRRAGEIYMQAINRLSALAVDARSQARENYSAYRASYDIAVRYRRDVLPLRKIIADESMLRYGAMQIDVFALLTEARQRIAANIAAIEAQRDFWLASSELDAALIGGSAATGEDAVRAPDPAAASRDENQ
jgi:outer membrane protein TolC